MAGNGKKWPKLGHVDNLSASDIDFRTKFCKAILILNINGCLKLSLDHLGPCMVPELVGNGQKWPKIGHLDDLKPQISILISI